MRRFTVAILVGLGPVAGLRGQGDEFGKWAVLFNGRDTTGWLNAKPD